MERVRLSQARLKKFWTLEDAAQRLGVDRATLARWEKGTSSPQPVNLRRLCDVYGVSSEEMDLAEAPLPRHTLIHTVFPTITAFLREDLTLRLMQTISNWPYDKLDKLQYKLLTILEEYRMQHANNEMITRRDTLRRLATMPFAILGLTDTSIAPLRLPDETLKQCASAITACWELSKSSNKCDLYIAFEGASAYLPLLKAIVKDSAPHRKVAASLAAQCDLLKTVLGWHRESLDRAIIYAREAVTYSEVANDLPLRIAILAQCSWLYHYARQGKKALEAAEQATSLMNLSIAPLASELQSQVQSALAVRYAKYGQQQQALKAVRLSHECFFRDTTQESRCIYADHDRPSLVLNDGMAHAYLGLHKQALDSFAQIIDLNDLSSKFPTSERTHIELLNNQVCSLLKNPKKDKELTIRLWTAAIQGAKALQSEQRFSEALASYDMMEVLWSGEKDIRDLHPLTAHW